MAKKKLKKIAEDLELDIKVEGEKFLEEKWYECYTKRW